jgi:thymidylate synthase
MREAVEAILDHGDHIGSSTEGANTELLGVTLRVANPRSRLSRTEARSKPFSCLGELCWYLSGSNATEQIVYYVSRYKRYDEAGQIFGGYGPRLYSALGANQLENVLRLLHVKPSSRQAVIQLFDAQDLAYDPATLPQGKKRDIPCTCVLQFFVRDELLQMMTYMRSNDAWFGLTHDLFCFTMLQEIVARSLGREPGPYTHFAGSLHIYDKHRSHAESLRGEGWQPTNKAMPPMPSGDPWPSIRQLLDAEACLRKDGTLRATILEAVDPYWADLIRLLQAYRYREDGNATAIEALRSQMVSSIFDVYLEKAVQTAANKTKVR